MGIANHGLFFTFLVLIWTYLIFVTAASLYGVVIIFKGSLGTNLKASKTNNWLITNHIRIAELMFILTAVIVLTFSFLFFLPISQLVFSHLLNFLHNMTTP